MEIITGCKLKNIYIRNEQVECGADAQKALKPSPPLKAKTLTDIEIVLLVRFNADRTYTHWQPSAGSKRKKSYNRINEKVFEHNQAKEWKNSMKN